MIILKFLKNNFVVSGEGKARKAKCGRFFQQHTHTHTHTHTQAYTHTHIHTHRTEEVVVRIKKTDLRNI
jgi:hypothetical protein